MKNLREQKYIALMAIVVLFMAIVGLISFGQIDKYKGKVKVHSAKITAVDTKFKASINDLSGDNAVESAGYDEIEYKINYKITAEEALTRNVVIKATLPSDEKYSSFKAINSNNITSTLSSNKKEIELHISNVTTNENHETVVKMLIQGAPNGYKVTPSIQVKEDTEENYTSVTVKEVEVKTNSLTGTVKDSDGMAVSGIELVIKKNNQEIKSTYTDENGKYVFSGVEEGTYIVEVDEEVYEKVSESNVSIKDSSSLDITVKQVVPYQIHTDKFITSVTITNNGKTQKYTYGQIRKVQQAVKNLKEMTGEVEYKIVVSNVGKKEGMVTVVKDELPEGLSFDKKKNADWEEKDGILYNRSLEGITLKAGEKREEKLVLDIVKTNEAKTYINKVTAKGEIYEKVVFILDGETYKEEEVLEGEIIKEEYIDNENFSGWYIDKNYTNKYNFKNPVRKDLILYGKTVAPVVKYKVTFNDKNPETGEITKWDEQEVKEGDPAEEPEDPEHTGYTFKCWEDENHNEWDFATPITSALVLTSCYDKNVYNVNFYDYNNNLVKTLKVKYKETVNTEEVPILPEVGHTFKGWYELTKVISFDFTTQITRDVDLYPKHDINKNEVTFDDENRITTQEVDYGSTATEIASLGKEGHTFKYWSLERNGSEAFDFTTPIIEPTTLYAVYQINVYDVIFIDKDPSNSSDEGTEWGERQRIEHGSKAEEPETNPEHTGYTFKCWQDETGYVWDFATDVVTKPLTLVSCYEINKYTVTYMDDGNLYTKQENIPYNTKTTAPAEAPTKENKSFAGWSLDIDADPIVNFDFENTPITSDITLHSHYVDILPPDISHTPTEWTRNSVTVTIEKEGHPEYKFKYKIGTGTYQDYVGPFTVDENCTVIAKSVVGTQESITTSHDITNIDKIPPVISSFTDTGISTTGFTVNVTAGDNESGLKYIRLYKDDVLETTITFNEYELREGTGTHEFTDLEEQTTYKIKAIAVDAVGNESEAIEKEIKTEYKIVARIIGRENSLYEDEEMYENFPSLDSAIKACPTGQCTIQMVLSTNESVQVLEGQDIKLDLNGKTVTGVIDGYTLKNGGKFQLVDWAETPGSIVNSTGIALYNEVGATLTLGELEEELVVSTQVPYVNGGTTGVYNASLDNDHKGILNFYDGKVAGTVAIDGHVTETPYLYNANVVANENRQVATLTQLAEAEARLKGVYYTKLQQAIDDAENGHYVEGTTETDLLKGFKKLSSVNYGFAYDEETNSLVAENHTQGSTAKSSTIIDLTNYESDQKLLITGLAENANSNGVKAEIREENASGTIINPITNDTYINSNSNSFYSYNYSTSSNEPVTLQYNLEKGKRYYVELINIISGTADSSEESTQKLSITSMNLTDYNLDGLSINPETDLKTSEVTQYGFEYDSETKTIKSNNQYVTGTAFSYIELDLTNSTEDKELIVNATLDSMYSSHYGMININEDNSLLYSDSYNALGYMYVNYDSSSSPNIHNVGTRNYTKVLTKGKKYYLQFYYLKNYSSNYTQEQYEAVGCKDQFTINTIDLVPIQKTGSTIDLKTALVTPGDYGWTTEGYSYMQNNNSSNDAAMLGSTAHSYIKVDMTNETQEKMMKIRLYSSQVNFYAVSNTSTDVPSSSDPGKFADANSYYITDSNNYLYANLKPGKINYVHFVYKRDSSNQYGSSISLYEASLLEGHSINLAKELKTNNKGFTEKYTSYNSYYPGNISQGTTYDSYIKVDLTNATTDQVLDINAELYSGENYRYMYITTNDKDVNYSTFLNDRSKSILFYNSYRENSYYVNGNSIYYDYHDFKYVLQKGNVYYVHYALYAKGSSSYDYSYIKSAMYYPATSNDLNIGTLPHVKGTEGAGASLDYVEDDGTSDKNFRYVGNNPKNYVTFNNETWRIIGIFDTKDENGNSDKRIKLIRDESLESGLAWDSTPYGGENQSINGGQGINEWSQADLMKLLNPGYDNNEEETFNVSHENNTNTYTSNGTKKVNNSLYWNKSSGTCITNMYNQEKSCDFTSNGLNETSKSMIDTVVWNTGAIPYDTSSSTGLSYYVAERGTNTTKSSAHSTVQVDDDVERKTTWTGKVALPYMSDYILASGDFYSGSNLVYTRSQCISTTSYGACTYSSNNANWLSKNTSPMSLLSPLYGTSGSTNAYLGYVAYAITSQGSMPAGVTNMVTKPVVFLNPKVKVKSGDGSQDDPFVFELGEEKNTTKNYGLIKESSEGEDDEDSFVEETETSDYEKLIVDGRKVLGFNYDAETSTFTNQNKGVPDSISVAYTTFDLTDAQEDKKLDIELTLSKTGDGYAYLNLLKDQYKNINYNDYNSYNGSNDDNNTSILSQQSSNLENKQFKSINLEKGHKYYLQFAYDKKNANPVSDTNKDEFTIKVKFEEPAETVTNYTRYDGITPILNQVVDTVEMLRDISLTTALTVEDTRDMILDLNGHTLTTSQNTYTITNNGSLKVIDSKYSDEIDDLTDDQDQIMNAYNQEKEAAETAAAAEYNALSKDDYIENDIKLNLSAKDHGEEEGKWKDLSGNNDFTINNATFDSEDGALVFDDANDFAVGELVEPETATFEITFSATSDEASTLLSTIGIGNTISLPRTCTYAELSTGGSCGSLSISSQGTSRKFSTYTTSLEQNKVYTLQILTSATNVYAYLNGTQYYYSNSSSTASTAEISKLILGRLTEEADSTFKGKIYSIRMYDRQLQKDEMRKNYRIDQKLYNASYEEDTSYNSKTLINNTFGYTVKDFSGDTIVDTTSGNAYISSTYSNGGYVPCISFTNSNSSNTNNTALITEELNFDTTYRYLQFNYEYRVYNSSYPMDIYIGLTKENNFTSVDDFEVFEKINANNTSVISKNITLKPTKIGKYRLKIVYVKTNPSSRVYTGVIYNLVLNKGEPVDLETRISTELNQTGEIVSTTSSTILNNEGANLEIEEGIINLKKAGTSSNPLYGIINKGTLSLGKRSSVDAASYSYGVGILNDTTGDIIDGEATIRGTLYSLHNRSAVDKNIKGYTFKSGPINNESQNALTLEDALITYYGATTAILDNTARKLTIKNSIIKATNDGNYVLKTATKGGIIEIEDSEITPYSSSQYAIAQGEVNNNYSWSNVSSSSTCKKYIIKNSTINGIIHTHCYDGEIELINSTARTVQAISGKTTIEKSKILNSIVNSIGYLYIKNSDLSNITGTIYNASNVRDGGYMYITDGSKVNSVSNYNYLEIKNSEVANISNTGEQSYATGRSTGRLSSTMGRVNITDSKVTGTINIYNGSLTINGIIMDNKNNTSLPAIKLTLNSYKVASSYSGSYTYGSSAKIDGNVKISGYGTGISAIGSGSLTIGTNDDTVGRASLKIDATDTGITSTAPLYWYDGSIRAKVDKTILNKISGFPTGYDIDIEEEDDGIYETMFLTPVDEHSEVAQIGNTKYGSLQAAFDAVPEDGTETEIQLIKKLVTLQTSTLPEGKSAKLNFNDKKMTYYNGSITNEGTLKLFDNTEEVTKENYTYNSTLINNSGTLEYNDVIFYNSNISNSGLLTVNSGNLNNLTISNTKDLVFNGGTLYNSNTTASGEACNVTVNNVNSENSQIASSGILTVLGGTYKDSSNSRIIAFKTTGGGTATITAGTYESSLYGIIDNAGTTTIEGIESSSKTIGSSTGTLILTNNTFDSMKEFTGLTSSGFVTFNSGSYSSAAPLISSTSGKLTINDTDFSSTSTGIKSSGNAKLLINDINIDTTGTAITIESSGETTILHGKIKSGDRGISNTINGTGEITIGQKGYNDEEETELVSTTDPEISGTNFGFANGREATVIKFYDGIIKGANPINSNINEVEDGYEVVGNPGNTEKWLGKLPVIRNIDQEIDYYDIQKAINEAGNGETLQFLREVTGLTTTPTYTVSAEKNLIIDLNGKKIIQNNEKFIDNAGTLKLTNSDYSLSISDTYKITTSGEGFLYNTGKTQMITNSGDLTLEKIVLRDATEGNVITNTGTLTMNNSQIEDLTSGVAITNTGTLTMDTVTISSDDSIVNDTTGKNIVNDGGTVTITKGILGSKKGDSIVSTGSAANLDFTTVKITSTKGNIITNTNGTVTIDTATMASTVSPGSTFINTNGTATINNAIMNVASKGMLIENTGKATFDNSTMTAANNFKIINNTNELTIKNSTITENTYINICFPDKDNSLITSTNKLTLIDTDISRTNESWRSSTACWGRTYYVFDEDERDKGQLIASADSNLSIKGGTFTAPGNVFVKSTKEGAVINIEDATINSHGGLYIENSSTSSTYEVTLKNNNMSNINYSIFSSNGSYKPYATARTKANIKIDGGTYSSHGRYTEKTFSAHYANERDKFESHASSIILLGTDSNLTIENATIKKPTYTLDQAKSIYSTSGTVTLKSGSVLGNIYKNNGTLNVESGVVESIDGVKNGSSSNTTINVKSGNITNDISASSCNVVLGTQGDTDENDDLVVSISDPLIGGSITAGSIKFYDGIVKGTLPTVTARETGYNVKNASNGHYLTKDNFIKNTSTNVEYNNLKTAFSEVQDGETLQVIDDQDVYENAGTVPTIPSTSTVTFDLNGKTLNIKAADTFINEGTLNVTGSGVFTAKTSISNKGITNINGGQIAIANEGTLNVNGGTLSSGSNASTGTTTLTSGTISAITNNGTLVIDGGTASFTNNANGEVTINDGTINSFTNYANGIVTMNDGIISGTKSKLNSGTMTIKDGTLKSTITNGGTMTIEKMTIDLTTSMFTNTGTLVADNLSGTAGNIGSNNKGTMTINNANLTLTNGGVTTNFNTGVTSSEVTINNGTYNVTGQFATATKGTINLNGATVTTNNNVAGVSGGTLNINTGTYTTTGSNAVNISSGTVNIGTEDTNVSLTNPTITSESYAVYQTGGNVNFYDGKLIGKTAPVYGKINEYEPGYKMSISHPDETYIGTLTPIGDDERVAVLNGINFTDLQQAINAARDNEEQNIVLYANVTLNDNVVVPATKIINVYLNGYTINRGDYTITNNGTFELKEGTPSSLGASIVESIKDALNISDRTKNVIVYEMEDGSKLSAENTYTLYKKADSEYQLMTMERSEEIGRYVIGKGQEEMTTVKGRLYIENLTSGEYKVKDNKGKEISFTIDDDLKVTGNVIENLRPSNNENLISTAIAELIITIQTGITRINYLALIIIMSGIIGILYLINRKKEFE